MPPKNAYVGGHVRTDHSEQRPPSLCLVEGMNVRDSRVHSYPPRWNAAPSQDLLVIRRNHRTGEVSLEPLRWGLVPSWCKDPSGGRKPINGKCETVRNLPTFREAHRLRSCIVPPRLRLLRAGSPQTMLPGEAAEPFRLMGLSTALSDRSGRQY
jgi:hypothetical protein